MILCCPECQSIEVYEEAGGYMGHVYRCKKCGYRGSFVLEIDEDELDKLKKRSDLKCPEESIYLIR